MGSVVWNEEYHKRCWRSAEWKRRASSLSCGAPKEEGLKDAEWNWGEQKEGGLRSAEWHWGLPKEWGLRSAEWNTAEPIQAEEHRWDSGVLIIAEEHQKRVGKECEMYYMNASGNWGGPIRGCGAGRGGYRVRNEIQEHWERRNSLWNEIEEVQSSVRSVYSSGNLPEGRRGGVGMKWAPMFDWFGSSF